MVLKKGSISFIRSLVAASALSCIASAANAQQATAQDRIYNRAQAKLGMAVYNRTCSACHDGGRMAPELWTEEFVGNWKGKKLSELSIRIYKTMPVDRPGTLTEEQLVNVIAYLLQMNGFPPGEKAIPGSKALASVTFVEP